MGTKFCYGQCSGTINAAVATLGGTEPLIYTLTEYPEGTFTTNLSGIFENLCSGIYSIYVADENECFYYVAEDISIDGYTPFEINYTEFNYSCGNNISCFEGFDGEINITTSNNDINVTYTLLQNDNIMLEV